MPTVARSCGWLATRDTQAALDGPVVAMVMMRLTPAATARAITAGKSPWNCSSSRWAWVSMSSSATSMRSGLGVGRGHLLQRLKVILGGGEQLLHLRPSLGVHDQGRVPF